MPTLYSYATDEVDGTIFDNIQRRIAHIENAGAYRLTEYPIKDRTNGKADKFIEVLIEDLASLNISVNTYTDMLKMDRELLTYETTKADNLSSLKQNIKGNIRGVYLIAQDLGKFERKMKLLRENIPYVSLSNFLDFRTAYDTFLNSMVELVAVGTDLMDFLMEDGLIKTKGYDEVLIDSEKINDPDEKPYYRKKITDKMIKAKMEEIAKRPDFVWSMVYDDAQLDSEADRVNLINQALEELGEREFFYNPNQTTFEDEDYTLFRARLDRIIDNKKLQLSLKKKKLKQQAQLYTQQQKKKLEKDFGDFMEENAEYQEYRPEGFSYDEEGNIASILEPEEEEEDIVEEDEEVELGDITNTLGEIQAQEEGLQTFLTEDRDLLRGLKLMSKLLKRINEPFKKFWEDFTEKIILIDDDMRTILNSFNEVRQQVLNNPNTLEQEKEDILQNPYGMTGSGFADMVKNYDYMDGKWKPKEGFNNNISLKYVGFDRKNHPSLGGSVGLSHPSRREMARYYGAGGSKYI